MHHVFIEIRHFTSPGRYVNVAASVIRIQKVISLLVTGSKDEVRSLKSWHKPKEIWQHFPKILFALFIDSWFSFHYFRLHIVTSVKTHFFILFSLPVTICFGDRNSVAEMSLPVVKHSSSAITLFPSLLSLAMLVSSNTLNSKYLSILGWCKAFIILLTSL